MGGIMSSPKPPAPPPLPPTPDKSLEEGKLAAEEREARLEDIKRRRRGRTGTVNTSWKGAQLSQNPGENTGKTLLGD